MENKDLVKKATKYIDKLESAKTTLEDVAKNAGFSVDYFNRMFRAHTGFNVMEYVRFRRLNRAARMLRLSPSRDILSIALDCGYESHEGFTRAFKEQYGKTPSEYRDKMKDQPFIWADHELNATAVSEFRYVLPHFFEKNADDVIDWLLEKDAKRYGYTAVTIETNGSKILCDHDLYESGCFVTVDNFYEKPYLTLVVNNIGNLRSYIEKLLLFSPSVIDLIFHTDVTLETVKAELDGIRFRKVDTRTESMYFGEPFVLPVESQKYEIRVLEESDGAAVDRFISRYPDERYQKSGGFGLKYLLKKPLSERPLDQPMGLFDQNQLLAVSYDALQSTHAFRLNNCVHTAVLPDTPKEAIRYLYLTATNSVMEKGYIPFEDTQFHEYAEKHGGFDAFDLGFEQVNTVFTINF